MVFIKQRKEKNNERDTYGWCGGGADNYWSSRAQAEYEYKGEKLYTITAAPYYVARRNLIVKSLKKIIHSKNLTKIADLGCGDGEYLNILHEENESIQG